MASEQFAFEKVAPPKKSPPCATCRPPLMRENAPAFEVWDRCGDEWITAGYDGAPIAIAGPSIEAALNISGVTDPDERAYLFDQVKTISRVVVSELAQDRERKRVEDKTFGGRHAEP
jgi:hypothetical protein